MVWFLLILLLKLGFCFNLSRFTITEASQLCKFTMSGFEFFSVIFCFNNLNNFNICYIDIVNLFCVLGKNISVWDYVFQFGLVVNTYEFFFDNSFVCGSTGFDAKFGAFLVAR